MRGIGTTCVSSAENCLSCFLLPQAERWLLLLVVEYYPISAAQGEKSLKERPDLCAILCFNYKMIFQRNLTRGLSSA